ncbi:ethanolamine ammonia-lyase subunit EutC [Aureimonas flava]|uniref:Ethanolamine ammonia-lyase small subunit n=1 Tax=Aureimonas flava TaxID=2320271 RepID=A0A3A1WQ44_9HYPH|nr:ethanolamine ammonia-lyase subunit EutC [Aureimonas flava]RIY02835.1 ethanolamine ammonia-lyase subunit EutC [Aureimonas flava]
MRKTGTPAPVVVDDPWAELRRHTAARIALGRVGTSLPTAPHLEFQFAHARARAAVHRALDEGALAGALAGLGQPSVALGSRAADRNAYLQRPDAGRRLDEPSRARLEALGTEARGRDVALVIGDGLSAEAVEANAAPLLAALLPLVRERGWSLAPVAIVRQARVAIGDEIGHALAARMVVVAIGERPGLSSPDSLGLYLTLGPRPGLTDEARNCISNVRAAGLAPPRAAAKLAYLMAEAFRRGLSGVGLKDEEEPDGGPSLGEGRNFLTDGD